MLITADSKAGPQAWVDAYHDQHSFPSVAPLPIKSGALQGVVGIDNALNQRFESLHIVYDGINGQLPNLDLFNTAVSIASGQMGIGVTLQRMWKHDDSYRERLQTMLRGMVSQGLGHVSGPHSSFIPYHIDAITLQAVGNGWQDEMAMGRCVESIFRSLNNLLEHLHQSFFFYLLMQANRFVSIGTYLPSAMLVAINFTIMAIVLWIQSGRAPGPKIASTMTVKGSTPEVEVIEKDGMTAINLKQDHLATERQLFKPIALIAYLHFLGIVPLYIFNNTTRSVSLCSYKFPLFIDKLANLTFPLIDASSNPSNIHLIKHPPTNPPRGSNLSSCPSEPPATSPHAMYLPCVARHVPRHFGHSQFLSSLPHRPSRLPLNLFWPLPLSPTLSPFFLSILCFRRNHQKSHLQRHEEIHPKHPPPTALPTHRGLGTVHLVRRRRGRITRRIGLWLEGQRSMDASCCLVRVVARVDGWRGIGESDACKVVLGWM